MSDSQKILVGKIVAPQGIRGEFRVQTYTENPMDFQTLDVFGNGIAGSAFKFVRRLNPTSDVVVARIDGVNDRNSAEALRGTKLFVERAALPDLADGEYYQSDLIGFDVVRGGKKIGVVACFQNFGAGDIIELDSGDMLSFNGADVDLAARVVKVI